MSTLSRAPYKGGEPERFLSSLRHPYRRVCSYRASVRHCDAEELLDRELRHGSDWAKKKDWTVITPLRIDVHPARLVALERTGRLDWPTMVGKFEERVRRYGGGAAHDMTGIGGVIATTSR
jgi:hypothetical protein